MNICDMDHRTSKKVFLEYLKKFECDNGEGYHFPKEIVPLIIILIRYGE